MDICLAAQMNEQIVGFKVSFHIERPHRASRSPDKAHCAVQINRNGGTPAFSIGLKPQRLQRLIEFGKIARLQIYIQVCQRITVVHTQHAVHVERRSRSLHVHGLDVHDLRAPVIVRNHRSRNRNVLFAPRRGADLSA